MDTNTITLILQIAAALVIIGFITFGIYYHTKNKKYAKDFLENFVNTLYKNILILISSNTIVFKKFSLEESKEKILNMIHDSCWDYIEASSQSAYENDKITQAILRIMSREFVDEFIDELVEELKIEDIIENKWREAQVDEDFAERVEAEDKALQEKFSDSELYNEEIDETKDLELADAGVAYTINEDGTTDEIERPADVEDPYLDTEQDESVEEIGEDGLTDSERIAGVRFNKSGRKIDKRGRFVK